MKRLLITLCLSVICAFTFAQNAEYKKAVSKYKNTASLTATATRTVHKAAVAKDKVTTGTLYVKDKGGKVLIANGKDALLMNGTAFTMKKDEHFFPQIIIRKCLGINMQNMCSKKYHKKFNKSTLEMKSETKVLALFTSFELQMRTSVQIAFVIS